MIPPRDVPRCSVGAADESLAGTAPYAQGWLLIASEGAWGAKAVEMLVGPALRAWAEQRDIRILLVRRHDRSGDYRNQYWLSDSHGTLLTGSLTDLNTPPELDSTILDSTMLDSTMLDSTMLDSTKLAEPMLVVCTNGARDQCCAIEGIALRKELQAMLTSTQCANLWEGTHIGGHRFAPTALYLPQNLVYGRLTPTAAAGILRDGRLERAFLRGRSHYPPCLQVLEQRLEEFTAIEWDFSAACPDIEHVHTGFLNDERLVLTLTPVANPLTVESCGKPAVSSITWIVTDGSR